MVCYVCCVVKDLEKQEGSVEFGLLLILLYSNSINIVYCFLCCIDSTEGAREAGGQSEEVRVI